ncbi:MAG: hypothetical protein ACTSU5_01100 [Promethearchaeota archaeon]
MTSDDSRAGSGTSGEVAPHLKQNVKTNPGRGDARIFVFPSEQVVRIRT